MRLFCRTGCDNLLGHDTASRWFIHAKEEIKKFLYNEIRESFKFKNDGDESDCYLKLLQCIPRLASLFTINDFRSIEGRFLK